MDEACTHFFGGQYPKLRFCPSHSAMVMRLRYSYYKICDRIINIRCRVVFSVIFHQQKMVVASSRFVIQRLFKPCLVLRSCSPKLNSFNSNRPEFLRLSSQIRFCSSAKNEREKENIAQQLKRLVGQYGSIVMVFHVSISLASLGFFYLIVSKYELFILVLTNFFYI